MIKLMIDNNNKFKVGDRIVYTGKGNIHGKEFIGMKGYVVDIIPEGISVVVEFDKTVERFCTFIKNIELFNPYEIELE